MSSDSDARELRDALERAQAALRQEQARAELHKQTSAALQEALREGLQRGEQRATELQSQLAEARETTKGAPAAAVAPQEEGPGWRYYAVFFGGPMCLVSIYALAQMREPSLEVGGLAALFGFPALAALISLAREWRR